MRRRPLPHVFVPRRRVRLPGRSCLFCHQQLAGRHRLFTGHPVQSRVLGMPWPGAVRHRPLRRSLHWNSQLPRSGRLQPCRILFDQLHPRRLPRPHQLRRQQLFDSVQSSVQRLPRNAAHLVRRRRLPHRLPSGLRREIADLVRNRTLRSGSVLPRFRLVSHRRLLEIVRLPCHGPRASRGRDHLPLGV